MFIGRSEELSNLKHFQEMAESSLCVIYGRRRIGKSLLIEHSLKLKRTLFFEGLEKRPRKKQLEHFVEQFKYMCPEAVIPDKISSWKQMFLSLYEFVKDHPSVIVFDEFQWMANYRTEIVSEFKFVWDRYFSKLDGQKIILCGSIASFMIGKVIKSSALYGRIELEIQVKGFSLSETKLMFPQKSCYEVAEAYMFTSGVPKYLSLLAPYTSIRSGIANLSYSHKGYFRTEYERIFLSHFGSNKDFETIIVTLLQHPYGLTREQIVTLGKVSAGGQLSIHLDDLEAAGFISSFIPVDKKANSRLKKYLVTDAYMRFYHHFILPNLKDDIHGSVEEHFGSLAHSGAFHNWIGRSFEYLVMHHVPTVVKRMGLEGLKYNAGPYFNAATKKSSGLQVDLLLDRTDQVLSVIEMKYSSTPVGIQIIPELERKLEWLREKFKTKTVQPVLVTKIPPTKELIDSGYFIKIFCLEDLFE